MLNIQPEPLDSKVEVRRRDHSISMGSLNESSFVSEILESRVVLDEAIDSGLFAWEDCIPFEFRYHFDTADEWTTYMRDHDFGNVASDQDLIDRTTNVLSQVRGEIVIREPACVCKLKRLD